MAGHAAGHSATLFQIALTHIVGRFWVHGVSNILHVDPVILPVGVETGCVNQLGDRTRHLVGTASLRFDR
jgi:hypothetical protein